MRLIIGNKNYSSWSLRAWLALRKSGVAFDEIRLPLDTPEFREKIGSYSPTGRVPVLHDGKTVVWDSLSICEYVSERLAGGRLWPDDPAQRALGRSASAEMHAGFAVLREQMPMNCRARGRSVERGADLETDIDRIVELWQYLRGKAANDGGWLFGDFSIADAMFAPVVFRFRCYGVDPGKVGRAYMDHVLGDDDIGLWLKAAEQEQEIIEAEEVGARPLT